MHIAIDTTPLVSGHEDRGIGVYTKNLIDSLQRYEHTHSYSFFTRTQKVDKKADLVHYPYFDPFFLTLPLSKQKLTVVTVHDLIPLVFPDKFPSGLRGRLKWQIQKFALKKADRVIADSLSSKKDIHRLVGLDSNRIDVIYLAPSLSYEKKQRMIHDVLKQKYYIRLPYILYVGDVNWNKNVPGLLNAFAKLVSDAKFKNVMLVLVGKALLNRSLPEVSQIHRLVDSFHLGNQILFPGYIPENDLSIMYSMAACLVQPSFYEGFGLPVLEAMACGCPVVAADNSSLSEIAGASIMVNAENTEDIARGIRYILISTDLKRKQIITEGFKWVASFTWQRVAKETVASYEKVVA